MRPKLSYANVVATLALFLALGGVGYAATQLPRNSVGRAQLKAGAVTSAKVKNKSLRGVDIKTGSLPDCPSGMKLAAGACLETKAQQATAYSLALFLCAAEGLRLPSQGELAAYDSFQYSGEETSPREWVEPSYTDGSDERANYVIVLKGGIGFGTEVASAEYAYRCAVGPTY